MSAVLTEVAGVLDTIRKDAGTVSDSISWLVYLELFRIVKIRMRLVLRRVKLAISPIGVFFTAMITSILMSGALDVIHAHWFWAVFKILVVIGVGAVFIYGAQIIIVITQVLLRTAEWARRTGTRGSR